MKLDCCGACRRVVAKMLSGGGSLCSSTGVACCNPCQLLLSFYLVSTGIDCEKLEKCHVDGCVVYTSHVNLLWAANRRRRTLFEPTSAAHDPGPSLSERRPAAASALHSPAIPSIHASPFSSTIAHLTHLPVCRQTSPSNGKSASALSRPETELVTLRPTTPHAESNAYLTPAMHYVRCIMKNSYTLDCDRGTSILCHSPNRHTELLATRSLILSSTPCRSPSSPANVSKRLTHHVWKRHPLPMGPQSLIPCCSVTV
jgi:hypothetical protein